MWKWLDIIRYNEKSVADPAIGVGGGASCPPRPLSKMWCPPGRKFQINMNHCIR